MSTLEVSNIHFESTGNSRIEITNSNFFFYNRGSLFLGANSTDVILYDDIGRPVPVGNTTNEERVGDIIFQYSNTTIPAGYVPVNVPFNKATYPSLAAMVSNVPVSNLINYFTKRTSANTNTLLSVTYGNGVYVAVGSGGSIQSSTDGVTWSNRTTANTNDQNGVTYGNGVFVSVGDSGSIQSSTNGTTWTNRTTANTNRQNSVAYGNGVFVSTGSSGSIQSSTNGTTWTNRTTANTQDQYAVVYGNGVFYVLGGTSVQTSTNGTTWTNRTASSTFPDAATYGNGTLYIYTNLNEYAQYRYRNPFVSSTTNPDTGWSGGGPLNEDNKQFGLIYVDGYLFSCGMRGTIRSSIGGLNSVELRYVEGKELLYDITYGNGVFVAVGANGVIYSTIGTTEAVATDSKEINVNKFVRAV